MVLICCSCSSLMGFYFQWKLEKLNNECIFIFLFGDGVFFCIFDVILLLKRRMVRDYLRFEFLSELNENSFLFSYFFGNMNRQF